MSLFQTQTFSYGNLESFRELPSQHKPVRIPEAARGRSLEGWAVVEQVSIEVDADVGLETVGEALEDHVHVDAVGVGPGMLEVFLQSLFQRVWYLVKLVELSHSLHGRMVP